MLHVGWGGTPTNPLYTENIISQKWIESTEAEELCRWAAQSTVGYQMLSLMTTWLIKAYLLDATQHQETVIILHITNESNTWPTFQIQSRVFSKWMWLWNNNLNQIISKLELWVFLSVVVSKYWVFPAYSDWYFVQLSYIPITPSYCVYMLMFALVYLLSGHSRNL